MQNTIYNILQDMSRFLSGEEMKELQRTLIRHLVEGKQENRLVTHSEYMELFLESKRIEGLSKKTLSAYRKAIENMNAYFETVPLIQISTAQLRVYLSDFGNKHNYGKASMDLQRRMLSSYFSWLYDEDYILRNPIKRIHKIKTEKRVKTVLTDEEIETLRDNCKNMRNLVIVELLCATGMRVGELVNLDRRDIDFDKRECIIFGKGSKERTAYFDAKVKIHLRKYLESRDDDNEALFVTLRKPHDRLQIGGVEAIVRKMGRELGIRNVHPHKFRRTMATKAIDKGMPVEQVQKLLGHTEINTTMTYAMVSQNNVKSSYKKYMS